MQEGWNRLAKDWPKGFVNWRNINYAQNPESTLIVSAMPDYKLYLVQLPDENQNHIRHCIRWLAVFFVGPNPDSVADESENAEATTDSVIKTIEDLRRTIAITEGMLSELVKAHGLPDDLRLVPDGYRKDFRDLLTGSD